MKHAKAQRILKVLFSAAINHDSLECFYYEVIPRLKESDHLELHIDSRGGEVAVALGLAYFLKSLGDKITTYNEGHCDSAAIVIFASGAERVAIRGCQFAMHEVGIDITGLQTLSSLSLLKDLLTSDAKRITQFLERQTGRAASLWERDMINNRHLSSVMAFHNGLATKIANRGAVIYCVTI